MGMSAEEASPPVEEEGPKEKRGDQMIEGAEAVDSSRNVEVEPGHETSQDDHGNATEEGVPPSAPAEEKEGFNRSHSRKLQQRFSKAFLAKEELWRESRQAESGCWDGEEMSTEDKDSMMEAGRKTVRGGV